MIIDDDFERKLLEHCEAHAHEDDSVLDTDDEDEDDDCSENSFTMLMLGADTDEDDSVLDTDDEGEDGDHSNNSFTMLMLGADTHGEFSAVDTGVDDKNDDYSNNSFTRIENDLPSDEEDIETPEAINIFSTIHEEETGIEVIMQRLCESCAMDVTDVNFERQCPFCMAAANFDSGFKDDSSSLCLDRSHRIRDGENHDRNPVSLTAGKRRVIEKQNDKILKGLIATFLQENKNAQGPQPATNLSPSRQRKPIIPESHVDTSPYTIPKESAEHDVVSSSLRDCNVKKETIEKFMRYHYSDDFHRLRELDKLDTSHTVSNLAAKSRSAIGRKVHTVDFTHAHMVDNSDTLDIRCQLTQLENYYSRQ